MSIETPCESTPRRSVSTITSAVVRTRSGGIPHAVSTDSICSRTCSAGTRFTPYSGSSGGVPLAGELDLAPVLGGVDQGVLDAPSDGLVEVGLARDEPEASARERIDCPQRLEALTDVVERAFEGCDQVGDTVGRMQLGVAIAAGELGASGAGPPVGCGAPPVAHPSGRCVGLGHWPPPAL